VGGPKIFKSKNRRSKRMKVDGLKLLKWTVSKFLRVNIDVKVYSLIILRLATE